MRTLLLDPDDSSREQLQRAFLERRWRVSVAGSVAEAVARFRADPFPLAVLDPGPADGAAAGLFRELRAAAPASATEILVLSGSPDPETVRRLTAAGADDVLPRPLDPAALALRLAAAEGRLRRPLPAPSTWALPDREETLHLQRALQESEARYRALFDQSPVGVFLCDARLRITHCNERLTEIAGVPRSAIVGTCLLDLPDERVLPGLERARQGETAFYEGPYRTTLSGARLWISVRYAPLRGPDGEVIGGIGVLEDITEREEAQRELRAQAAELERVNEALRERTLELEAALQARSRLYSAMNHELRTPISAIMLYQELLLAGSLGPLQGEQHEALERAHTAASHLLELVQEVLDLSKLEAGKVSVHPVEVAMRALLRDLRSTALPLARRYGSEIHLDVDPEQPAVVTDPQRVRQILLNLLSNAAKFGRGRPIVVRCRGAASGETRVEVEDRGIGIDPADLSRIFEDFVQIGNAEGGTGLGLAISRRLAAMLGGRLEVESEIGEGSTFRLVLPPARGAPGSTAEEEEATV